MKIIKRTFVVWGFKLLWCCSFVQAMDEIESNKLEEVYVTIDTTESVDPLQLLTAIVDKDAYDEEFDCVLVERIPFEQLDLSYLTEQQFLQKEQKCGTGTLFLYEKEVIDTVFKKFEGIKGHSLRSLFRYEPSQKNKELKPTVLFVVHGTFGKETEGYFHPESEQLQGFIRYATQKAEKEGRSVDIFSVLWTGENSDAARFRAGIFLGFVLNMIKGSYDNLDVIAFSHGCNVALLAANILLDGYKIREFIALAPPVLEDNGWFYAPHNIKYFFPYLSQGDMIKTLGRFWSSSFNTACDQWNRLCQKSLCKEPFDKDGRVYKHPCEKYGILTNIHYTHNNEHPSHTQLPHYISLILPEIMEKLYTCFMYNTSVRNVSINWVPQELCTKHDVEQLNISLFPQNPQEELIYAKRLRIETIYGSAKHEQDHFKVYERVKNEPDGYIYTFYNRFRNLFK